MNIRIEKMTNPTKEILDLTTNWMFNWWGNEDNYSYSDVFTYMANSFNEKKLPQTYLMFLDDKIIGMYQITYRDLFIRPDIYPWVANIYIDKNYRKQGYGKLLIKSIKPDFPSSNVYQNVIIFIIIKTDNINVLQKKYVPLIIHWK